MLGDVYTDLIAVVLVFLAPLTTICRVENDLSLMKLPEWNETSDYVAWCFYSQHGNLTCDWTSSQRMAPRDIKMEILVSRPLTVTGKACLEFWHLALDASSGVTLRALLKIGSSQMEIWTSPPLTRDEWRHASVPLNITELGTQVIFEVVHPLSVDQTTLKQIGVRRGSCRNQCDSNTELWTSDSTRCLCSVGQLFCFLSHCPKGQTCGPQRDGPSRISPSGVCTIYSNTDCQTFDGAVFRFMSPCNYVLAKTCSASEALPKFTVEVVYVQNGMLPTIQQINVHLVNQRVSLLRSQTHRAVVNGVTKVLPLSLNNDTIHITSNPAAVTLESGSGVSVSYDYTGAVQVRIPLQYSDGVCGLCGNFNQLPGDDLLKPDGTKAESATALAESWQTGGNVSCETIQIPRLCDPLDESRYSNENYCGLLYSGSFASCLTVVGAESYFRACLLGLCSNHGDQKIICETLQAYADICQEAGIAISTWRNSTFCSLECGKNSHYNSCADGCPKVCSSLDQMGLCGSCEERCECNSGFKLSRNKCVPAEHCGCWYNGKHYERGETTVEGDCVQQCQCIGNGAMKCTAMKCAVDEVCKERNGIKDCFPFKPVTCSVYGDPHYVTFDKLAYNFQGGCAYTLTTTCGGQSNIQFTVTGFNSHPTGKKFSSSKLEAVALQLDGMNLTLTRSREVDVDGVSVALPYSTNGSYGSVWLYADKDFIILETTFGLKLWLDRRSLFLQVDEHYKYELCGLCGTYSGYQEDDFVMPGGHIASGSLDFGDSWRIHTNDECTARPNDQRECVKTVANEECSMVFNGGFEACHEHVHPSIYFSSCVYDHCGGRATLCESLKSYATACQVEGVELPHWQTGTTCAAIPTTPGNASPDQTFCPINCNFDTNVCGWEQLGQESFDWTRHSGAKPSNRTGPNQDHTTGAGFYIYLEGDYMTHGDSARMLSPSCQLDGPICLHFWYYMYGSATMALNVYQLQGNATKIWSTMNNKRPEWQLGTADLKMSGPFQVIIEGIRGSTDQSDVAVDDITITSGSCSACNFDCSFKNSFCTWRQMVTDAFAWTKNNGSTPAEMTGSSSNHTGDGHYIYIEATSVTYGDTARLLSSECADTGPQCLQFWYHMYGSADEFGLDIYLLQNKVAKAVWQRRNNQGNMWHLAQVDLDTTVAFQIIFEGRRGFNNESDVAIDDITLHHGRCSELSGMGTAIPIGPDFNGSIPSVGWPTTTASEPPMGNVTVPPSVDWPTTTASEPPMGNVTVPPSVGWPTTTASEPPMGNVTVPPSVGWPTTTASEPPMGNVTVPPSVGWPTTTASEPPMGNVTVPPSVGWPTTTASEPPMGNVTVPPSVGWPTTTASEPPMGNVTVPPSVGWPTTTASEPPMGNVTVPPSVGWPTTTASEPPVLNGTVQVPTLNLTVPPKLTTVSVMKNGTKAPDLSPVCPLDCDFEQDFCQWSQMLTDVFDWERRNGSTSTLTTGPPSDHTTGDGHYLHIEANRASLGDAARLISNKCSDTGPQCLMFWYHMHGSADTMGLQVYLLEDKLATVLWTRRNDQGNEWQLAQVNLVKNGTFQIIFEGRKGANDESDVALDDIKLLHGVCKDLVKPTTAVPATLSTRGHVPATPSNESGPRPSPTAGLLVPATASNETGPRASPTAGLHLPTAQGNGTAEPQVPATAKPAPSNETGPRPSPTAGPQVPPTAKPAPSNETGPRPSPTAGTQVPPTAKPAPSNETGPRPSPTTGPQVPPTAKPAPLNETGLRPSPTAGPHLPTAQGNGTAGPQVPPTAKPAPSNETGPRPSPTAGLHLPTAQGNGTAEPQVPATAKPAPSNETGPRPSPTAGPQVPPTAKPAPSNETGPRPSPTTGPQVTPTAKPAPLNETGLRPSPTAGPHLPTAQGNGTAGPQVPPTAKPAPSNETGPRPSPTAGPQVPPTAKPAPLNETGPRPSPTAGPHLPTAQGNGTAGPQVPPTAKQAPSNETGPRPSPTTGPQVTPTAKPAPSNETGPRPSPTTGPQVTPTAKPAPSNETGPRPSPTTGPQVTPTAKPAPLNETGPRPSPTAGPHLPTAQGNGTAGPQVPPTAKQAPSNETGPRPSPTTGPQVTPTAKPAPSNETGPRPSPTTGPQVTPTAKPAPLNETGPRPSPTAGPHLPTAQGNGTAGPQVPPTAKQAPSNETGPRPSPTTGPQVTPTAKPAPSNETGPRPSPTTGPQVTPTAKPAPLNETGLRPSPTTGPQVTPTAKPAPLNETGPRPSPTAGPHLPTAQGNGTAGPQVPPTAKQAPSNETGPRPSPTTGPQVTPTAKPAPSNETGPRPSPTTGPQVTPTAKPAPSNETGPRPSPTTGPQVTPIAKPAPLNETGLRPSPTAGPHLPTAQGNGTAEPQATAKPAPSNETGPRPSPTAGLHLPTAQGNGTAEPQATAKPAPSNETGPRVSPTTGPKVPATTRLEPSPKTESHPSNTTGPQMTPEILPTNELQVPTLRPNLSTFTMRLQETVVPQPGPSCAENSHYTTCIPACKPTCENLNVPPQCSAEKTCVAGCVCDDGFVQKGSVCMPLQRCGCINGNGTTYNFNEIWYIDHCTKKCECEEDDGKGDIHCKDKAGCEGDAVCLHLERGKYYCEATEFGECTIQGDPEYKTFDKLKHDFSGTSIYVLVRTKNLPENLPEIYIEGTNTCTDDSQNDSEEKDWSTSDEDDAEIHKSLQELKIKVYNHTVELKHQRKVFVDGQRIRVPGSSAPGLEIQMHSSQIYLKTDFGLSVEFSGHCKTEIILPFLYKRRVEGLCGNFDGRKTNEKVKPDGTIAKNTHDFGESWRV